jgi:hypothetical protein
MAVNEDALMDFLHKFVGDLGATMAAGNVLVGDRLGLYRALAEPRECRRAFRVVRIRPGTLDDSTLPLPRRWARGTKGSERFHRRRRPRCQSPRTRLR